jgi:hypothetical protein
MINKNPELLNIPKGNKKVGKHIHTFSIPAGWSCPFAHDCLAKADRKTGKIQDGPDAQFRCFSASDEALYPNVRESRWNNWQKLLACKTRERMRNLILASLPKNVRVLRIHVGGDFFNEQYFLAWMDVATVRPDIIFYGYTKSLPFWVQHLSEIPSNLKLTASKGGKHDELIDRYQLKQAVVVFSPEQAEKLGLEVDHDDTHAYLSDRSFALLVHGTQAAGSAAGKAISAMRERGIKFSYGRK